MKVGDDERPGRGHDGAFDARHDVAENETDEDDDYATPAKARGWRSPHSDNLVASTNKSTNGG